MRILKVWLLIIIAILSACTHSQTITRSELQTSLQIDHGRKANDVFVFMASGSKMEADNITISIDSTRWKDPYDKNIIVVPTSDISSIYYIDRWAGLIDGIKFGLTVGGTTGAIGGYQLAKDLGGDGTDLAIPVMTAAYFGFLSAAVCGPPGFVFGRKERFYIDQKTLVQENNLQSRD